MKEYIEREALFRDIESIPDEELLGNDNTTLAELPRILDIISEQPTADVQEVVRCGQCRKHTLKNGSFWCRIHMEPVYGNNFCSWGEKMDKG